MLARLATKSCQTLECSELLLSFKTDIGLTQILLIFSMEYLSILIKMTRLSHQLRSLKKKLVLREYWDGDLSTQKSSGKRIVSTSMRLTISDLLMFSLSLSGTTQSTTGSRLLHVSILENSQDTSLMEGKTWMIRASKLI